VLPVLRDAQAYWPMDRWQVERLVEESRQHFRAQFDEQFWSAVPAIDGAVDACLLLEAAGYELVCVSAVKLEYRQARFNNLRRCGFPIERVIATDGTLGQSVRKPQHCRN
jgi:hypothetical protein